MLLAGINAFRFRRNTKRTILARGNLVAALHQESAIRSSWWCRRSGPRYVFVVLSLAIKDCWLLQTA
jgi:hypothetical protein